MVELYRKKVMKTYKERNNLEEIDSLIHERIYGFKNWNGLIPKYSSDFSLAMSAAEKVDLFSTIMLAKDGENWMTLHSPTQYTEVEYQKIYSSGLGVVVVAFSSGFTAAEAIARACLVLKAKENKQSSRSDQQSVGVI